MYPRIPIKNSDVFITPAYGTRLDLLANEYYKDSTLWWIIARANNIGKGNLFPEVGFAKLFRLFLEVLAIKLTRVFSTGHESSIRV